MKIEFSNHAITRLLERHIDPWKTKEVVKSPSWRQLQTDGSMAVRKEIEGVLIEVIYIEKGRTKVIKTAYFPTK